MQRQPIGYSKEEEVMRCLVRALLAAGAIVAGIVGSSGAALAQSPAQSPTLEAVKKRGQLICGVDTGIPGFAFQDAAGKWQGLDIAYCRAIAAAGVRGAHKAKYNGP